MSGYGSAPPRSALETACIAGCLSRVQWEYDDGEPQTYDHPGYPDSFIPVSGCTDAHLDDLSYGENEGQRNGELARLYYQWDSLDDAAWMLARLSHQHLNGRPVRIIVPPMHYAEDYL